MKRKLIWMLAVGLLFAGKASAQSSEAPKAEVSGDYSYAGFYPSKFTDRQNANGGGGSFAYFWKDLWGLKGDFQGYSGSTNTFTVPAGNVNVPAGAFRADGNLFTYLFGPVIQPRKRKWAPFGEALFGGAHSDVYSHLFTASGATGGSPSKNAFGMALGGGLDVRVKDWLAIRPVEIDYLLTKFENNFTPGTGIQNNFRYVGGLVFRFGKGAPPPPPNRPPTASCSAETTQVYAGSGDVVGVRADASDPDNDPLNYVWSTSGGKLDGSGPNVRWSSAGVAPGDYSVSSRVDDGRGGVANCAVTIHVVPRPNRPPVMSCSANPRTVHTGDRSHITAVASDPDNDPLTYSWRSSGGRIVGSGPEVDLDTTNLQPSRYTVNGRVDDGRGGSADCQTDVTVEPSPLAAVEARLAIRSVYFPTALPTAGKPEVGLVASQQKTLTSLASDFKVYLASKPDAKLVLEGHADPRGGQKYNQALSERRVEITKSFLISHGIPEGNLQTKAFGDQQEMTADQVKQLVEEHPNLTPDQRNKILGNLQTITLAQNRRVDVTLSSTGQQSVRQYPFNAEDSLTLLSRGKAGAAEPAPKPKPKAARKP